MPKLLVFKQILACCLLSMLLAAPAMAIDKQDYKPGTIQVAQAEGKTVVLDFHAAWCGTCRKQAKAFDSLKADKDLENVVLIKVDYDKEAELKKKYNIAKQSTLIVLKNNKEVGRVTGVSDPAAIKQIIVKGV